MILSLRPERDKSGLAFKDPRKFYNTSNERFYKEINKVHHPEEETVDYLYKTMGETLSSADYIFSTKANCILSTVAYPSTELPEKPENDRFIDIFRHQHKSVLCFLGSF